MTRKRSIPTRLALFALASLAALGSLATVGAAAALEGTEPATAPAQWHKQTLKFDYTGFTTLYTCDGLEGKVRQILLTFGARDDAKVHATGCNYGP
ncbi:MAG: hypothetical protein KGJ52_03555, partial [Gammaproteobacteria bacterium]|nr:hypothetical protein [Gammaproteobacteria bacterium]